MQTMKSDSKSKKSGKGAASAAIVPVAATPKTQEQATAETTATQDSGAEVQTPITQTVPVQQEEPQVQLLDLNKIVNSTYNPRKDFREETLLELSESIRQSGVLQPICVRPKDEGFEIVYGERRYWAAAMAGLKYIPAPVSYTHLLVMFTGSRSKTGSCVPHWITTAVTFVKCLSTVCVSERSSMRFVN